MQDLNFNKGRCLTDTHRWLLVVTLGLQKKGSKESAMKTYLYFMVFVTLLKLVFLTQHRESSTACPSRYPGQPLGPLASGPASSSHTTQLLTTPGRFYLLIPQKFLGWNSIISWPRLLPLLQSIFDLVTKRDRIFNLCRKEHNNFNLYVMFC